jgi:hypothetical protein
MLSVATFLGLAAFIVEEPAPVARTPFGTVPEGCTVEVPHGTHVEEDAQGLRLSHPTLGTWHHAAPSHCSEPLRRRRHASSITCDSLPCNNWIDNAGWQQPTGATAIGGFSSNYVVPATPKKPWGTGQTLFYFIGAENTDGQPRHGQPPPSGRAILQPVLTFDPDGWCKASKTGWCFSSWYCCPKNLTVHSTYLQDVAEYDTYASSFNLSAAGDAFTVIGTSAKTGKSTSLSCPRQGRSFNWADVTLEVYAIDTCDMFSPSEMSFSQNRLWDVNQRALTPTWTLSPASPCGGSIIVDPEEHGAVHITHNSAAASEWE